MSTSVSLTHLRMTIDSEHFPEFLTFRLLDFHTF